MQEEEWTFNGVVGDLCVTANVNNAFGLGCNSRLRNKSLDPGFRRDDGQNGGDKARSIKLAQR